MLVKVAKVQIELNFHSIEVNQCYVSFLDKVIVKTKSFYKVYIKIKSSSFSACVLKPANSARLRKFQLGSDSARLAKCQLGANTNT